MNVEQTWTDFMEVLETTADAVLTSSHLDGAMDSLEGVRYLTRLISSGALVELENFHPAYPRFTQLVSPWRQWGLPNPDYTYFSAKVHGDFTYRITGQRGSARFLTFATHAGRPSEMNKARQISSLIHFDDGTGDLSIGPGGTVEVLVSREEQEGNWLGLPEEDAAVSFRNAFYDWDSEEPSMLFIERVGATYPAPPFGEDDLRLRVGRLIDFVRERQKFFAMAVDQAYEAEPGTVQFGRLPLEADGAPPRDAQIYGQGVYHCELDEAVILEVTPPPDCLYWNFHLVTKNWEAFDWDLRQTSLNPYQAVIDADGVFRAVISHADPEIPNWLDASNHTTDLIAGRYRWYGNTGECPVPRLKLVPLTEVRDHLPSETPVVSPTERSSLLRRRMLAAQRLNSGM